MRYLLFIFFLSSSITDIFGQVNLTNGLVGKYCLDGDGTDQSTYLNHGNVVNATVSRDRFGNAGGAMYFTGNNSYMAIPPINQIFSTQYTYSFWYNVQSNPAYGQARIMLGVGGDVCDQTVNITNGYFNAYWGITVGGYYNPSSTYSATNGVLPPVNQWNHIASVKKSDSIKLYINGVLIASKRATQAPCYQGSDFGVKFAGRAGHNQFFEGTLDDLWLYDRALTDEEIAAIYRYDGSLNFSLGNDTSICFNQNILLDCKVDNATYLWSNGMRTKTITVTDTGTYWVTVNKNCVSMTDSIRIESKAMVQVTTTAEYCPGDSVSVAAHNFKGSSLEWSTGEITPVVYFKSPGLYWVKAINATCEFIDTVSVLEKISTLYLGPDAIVCNGGSLVLDGTSFYTSTYLWNDSSDNSKLTVTAPGIYWVECFTNGCVYRDSIVISLDTNKNPLSLGPDRQICNNGKILLSGTTPGSAYYLWSDGSSDSALEVSNPGLYWVESMVNGCNYRDSIIISIDTNNMIDLGPDTTICQGGSIVLNIRAVGNISSYLWNNSSINSTLQANTSGLYWVECVVNGCTYRDSINISQTNSLFPKISGDTVFCPGDSVVLNAFYNGASTYQWSNSETRSAITVKSAGKYKVRVSLNNCFAEDSVETIVKTPPALSLGNDTTLCKNSFLILDPGNFNTYLWSDGTIQKTLSIDTIGLFWCEVSDGACTSVDTILITSDSLPSIIQWNDTLVCAGSVIYLNASTSGNQIIYTWNDGTNNPSKQITEPGTYKVNISHNCGIISNQITVDHEDCDNIFVPTAFTPNNDQVNDLFRIMINNPRKFMIQIFDRWGERVFYSEDPEFAWDGIFNGKPLPDGLYGCLINGISLRGIHFNKSTGLLISR